MPMTAEVHRVVKHSQGKPDYCGDRPEGLVLSLLFVLEMIQGGKSDHGLNRLDFFMARAGGVHLLLLLLNAYYNKRAAGRMPGWTFGVLKRRIRISDRSLRKLILDGLNSGLITQLRGERDRRCRVYCLQKDVAKAWEDLFDCMKTAMPDLFAKCGPGELANLDFRSSIPAMSMLGVRRPKSRTRMDLNL